MSAPSTTVAVDLALSAVTVIALAVLAIRLRHGQRAVSVASAELRRSEERFRRLAEASPLGIFELDEDGQRVYANPRLLEITGSEDLPWSTEDGQDLPWRVPPEAADARVAEWRAAAMSHQSQSGRWRVRGDDGGQRWVRFDAAPLIRANDFAGWIGSVADVTDEHELAERNAQLSEVIEITPDLVAVIDVKGRLSYLNRAARDIWGLEITS